MIKRMMHMSTPDARLAESVQCCTATRMTALGQWHALPRRSRHRECPVDYRPDGGVCAGCLASLQAQRRARRVHLAGAMAVRVGASGTGRPRGQCATWELRMDASVIPAIAALMGAAIGSFTSVVASWLTQHTQARMQRRAQNQNRRPMAHIYCCGLLHACLHTSCWVVQLRVQGELPAGFRVPVVGPTTTQAFWQFITWVSQATKQAVDV
jgi:hypothetical protein